MPSPWWSTPQVRARSECGRGGGCGGQGGRPKGAASRGRGRERRRFFLSRPAHGKRLKHRRALGAQGETRVRPHSCPPDKRGMAVRTNGPGKKRGGSRMRGERGSAAARALTLPRFSSLPLQPPTPRPPRKPRRPTTPRPPLNRPPPPPPTPPPTPPPPPPPRRTRRPRPPPPPTRRSPSATRPLPRARTPPAISTASSTA